MSSEHCWRHEMGSNPMPCGSNITRFVISRSKKFRVRLPISVLAQTVVLPEVIQDTKQKDTAPVAVQCPAIVSVIFLGIVCCCLCKSEVFGFNRGCLTYHTLGSSLIVGRRYQYGFRQSVLLRDLAITNNFHGLHGACCQVFYD